MKRIILAVTMSLLLNLSYAQIEFAPISFEEALQKAKEENKGIFIDVSTTWCGPCKHVKAKIFPEPLLADYHNREFINLYLLADKDEAFAAKIVKRYGYTNFPTFIYLNSDGVMTHKFVGGNLSVKEFLAQSKMAKENRGLTYLEKTYNSGERDVEFLKEYISALSLALFKDKAEKLSAELFSNITLEELLKEENFEYLRKNIIDLDAKAIRLFLSNYDRFLALQPKETEKFRYEIWKNKAYSYVIIEEDKPIFDEKGYKEFCKRLKKSGLDKETRDDLVTKSELMNAYNLKDWEEYVDLAIVFIKSNYKNNLGYTVNTVFSQTVRIKLGDASKETKDRFIDSLQELMAICIKARDKALKESNTKSCKEDIYVNLVQNCINDLK